MARHDHQCNQCKTEFEANRIEGVQCPQCGSDKTVWKPSIHVPTTMDFWHPHLDSEPVHITSVKQLDRELEKRNLHIPEGKKRGKQGRLPRSKEEAKNV